MSANPLFTVKEVLSASCAVHRINGGFVKTADANPNDGVIANSQFLYNHFLGTHDKVSNTNKRQLVEIKSDDEVQAEAIMEYLKGLTFKAMERDLTDFEKNVLKLVTAEEVGKDKIGIAASLPKVYANKQTADVWAEREAALSSVSEYVGTEGKRGNLKIVIENIRFISSVGSKLFCASVDGKHIVKFFSNEVAQKVGDNVAIGAYVKSHSISKYHHGKETMVNRIKVLDK
jgi:hypothetical protein|tara:strand:- start:586 stop:1278 length:693 start_codon:yes stop_codon:yes gene_type:complete